MLIQIEIPIYMFMLMLTFSPILLIANFCLYSSSSTVRGSYDGTRVYRPTRQMKRDLPIGNSCSCTHTSIHIFLFCYCVQGSQWETHISSPLLLHTLLNLFVLAACSSLPNVCLYFLGYTNALCCCSNKYFRNENFLPFVRSSVPHKPSDE